MATLILILILAGSGLLNAQDRLERYALILEDPPLAEEPPPSKDLRSSASQDRQWRIEIAQQSVRRLLSQRGCSVTGATRSLLNAVYVAASEGQLQELQSLPGVVRVVPMLPLRRHMDRAVQLVKAPAAWSALGGPQNAGAGVRIGILDTGVDHNHPAFQDSTLQPAPGYPKCPPKDCAFTNNKVIVARSYVESLVLGDQPEYSRPDDTSARDRVGHGTATAMVAAGAQTSGPAATVSGIAPKAFLGSYKVYGSPGVNDYTFDDVVIQALEDALNDGMDIVILALGRAALWGPEDRGSDCGNPASRACDPRTEAVERAVRAGLTVVVSAGNDGDLGLKLPALNSINTPGAAPSAITVGASTNSHILFSSVRPSGGDVPAGLRRVPTLLGNGPKPAGPLTAPLRDVATMERDGLACEPIAAGSLSGAIALIDRGDCGFAVKVNHAQKAGALAAIIVQRQGSNFLFPMTGLSETGIPAALIGSTDGRALRSLLASHPDRPVTLDPSLEAVDAEFDTVAYFSSQGPAIGGSAIKPELVAVGTDLYVATQRFDPNGD
ncbi:MAG: S8 family serine peptidase, partial [Gemmatimonadetes bacterium]|nr:S8 family serine peptidase [Gemmatimonadota bacterium]